MRMKNASVPYSKSESDGNHAEKTAAEHSRTPKSTQGNLQVLQIMTKVDVKEFPNMKMTVKSSLPDFQKLMKAELTDHMEIIEEFRRNSAFGTFLDVQLVTPPAMLWQLMVREANVRGKGAHEMWFVVNRVLVRYSLMEFSLITGLKCLKLESRYDEKYDSNAPRVFVEENWPKGVVCYTSVVQRFSKLCHLLKDEEKNGSARQWIVKVAILMFLVLVLIGHAKKDVPIPNWIIAKVANSDNSMAFPWGTCAFMESLRIQSMGKELVGEKKKFCKGGKTSNTLHYTGFVLPPAREVKYMLLGLPALVRELQSGDKPVQICVQKDAHSESEDEDAARRISTLEEVVHSASHEGDEGNEDAHDDKERVEEEDDDKEQEGVKEEDDDKEGMKEEKDEFE
ncbi:unnamed protein product [Cuscuta campestris]|uniref:DUF1985 domain-containing protein n=1 Tax=Cuscuta campestris TaxID=132261 RepID=A0A484N7G0_9ASTE|nr:unnamed protein product [Cuscuta campestris]